MKKIVNKGSKIKINVHNGLTFQFLKYSLHCPLSHFLELQLSI